jgi:hypothetical protein
MHDIATEEKHSILSKPKAKIKERRIRTGDFNKDFNFDFSKTILEIELDNGTILNFRDEIKHVISFWMTYFSQGLNINLDAIEK